MIDIRKITTHFAALQAAVPLRPIRTAKDYDAAIEALDALFAAGANDENHPLSGLASILGNLIGAFEDEKYPLPEVSGAQMLSFLMESNNLKQSDLPEIGSQGVVSEILSGKRALNLNHVTELRKRFGVPADVFLPESAPAYGEVIIRSGRGKAGVSKSRIGQRVREDAVEYVEPTKAKAYRIPKPANDRYAGRAAAAGQAKSLPPMKKVAAKKAAPARSRGGGRAKRPKS